VVGLIVTARYWPVGRWAPDGTGAFTVNFPVITTRYTRRLALPGIRSPGVAACSASAWVVRTALIEAGCASPLNRARGGAILRLVKK
jgi:hypothetical protein